MSGSVEAVASKSVELFNGAPVLFLVGVALVGGGFLFYKLGAKLLDMINNTVEKLTSKVDELTDSLKAIETTVGRLGERLAANNESQERMYKEFNDKVSKLDNRIDDVSQDVTDLYRTIPGDLNKMNSKKKVAS